MLNLEEYVSNPLGVVAVLVTEHNMHEVAKWCGGVVQQMLEEGVPVTYIKVKTVPTNIERNTQARVGDHVVQIRKAWKVYNPGAFRKSFSPKPKKSAPVVQQDGNGEEYGTYPGYESVKADDCV